MTNSDFGGYQPPAAEMKTEEQRQREKSQLGQYLEIQELIDSFPQGDNTRYALETAFSSTDPKYGSLEKKVQLALSGQYTGVHSPEFQKWRQSPSFQRLQERMKSQSTDTADAGNRERLNQAETMLSLAKARLEAITKDPGLKKDPMEDAKLNNEIELWQKIVDNKGAESSPDLRTQTKTERR